MAWRREKPLKSQLAEVRAALLSSAQVEFALVDGTLRATDYAGHTFEWGTRVADGEIWVPTVAWTGSRASILLAPPSL